MAKNRYYQVQSGSTSRFKTNFCSSPKPIHSNFSQCIKNTAIDKTPTNQVIAIQTGKGNVVTPVITPSFTVKTIMDYQ